MPRPLLTLLLIFASSLVFASAHDGAQAFGEPAWGEAKAGPATGLRDVAFPASDALVTIFPRIDAARVDAMRIENTRATNKLLMIGVERSVAEARPDNPAPTWRAAPGGGHTARIEVASPGAIALRAGLEIKALPSGAELRFLGNEDGIDAVAVVTHDEVATQMQANPVYWTPVTDGERQQIEIFLPAGADPRWTRVSLHAVSHLFVAPHGSLAGAKIGESDSCEFDAKCVTNPSTAYNNAKNAVARMVFQTSQGSSLCTGTLLNDTDTSTQVPNFFGAAHCFTSQSIASTLTTFWFFEATACASGVLDGSVRQITGGATVQFASTASDVLLLRLNTAPPAGAFFLGWNAAAIGIGTDVLVLHHPAGDVKKVSLGQVKGLGPSNLASGNFIQVGYTDGTTEGGSSGCGLLTFNNTEYQLRGGLLGGSAGCANTGTVSTPANSDDFSRFDQVFASLQPFLQPSTTTPPSPIDYSGAWSAPSQGGWGMVVLRGGSGLYAVNIYHYDQDSSPLWFLSSGALSGTSFSQSLIVFTGPWFGLGSFNPNAVTNRVAGTINVNFTSATTATVSFTADGRTVSTTMNKVSF